VAEPAATPRIGLLGSQGPRSARPGGEGPGLRRLGTVLADQLSRRADLIELSGGPPPAGLDAIVTFSGGEEAADPYHGPLAVADGARSPWLPIWFDFGTAVIGPLTVPGVPGCPRCVAIRRRKARHDQEQFQQAQARFADRFDAAAPRLTCWGADVIAQLAATEVTDGGNRLARRTVIRVRLDTLQTSVHSYLPEPACPDCGGLPADSPDSGRIQLGQPRKLGPRIYRTRDLRASRDDLMDTYVDAETGLIRGMYRMGFGVYPATSAPMGLSADAPLVESGYGRDLDFRASQLTAIAEAVERYGGVRPGARRTVVRGSYSELATDALDPKTLGLYPEDRYAQPGFPFQRYHDDLRVPWVWGYSFARDAPILVPECCAYYRLPHGDPADRPFVYEISNGCAVGSCMAEAILHGIVELVERDAFLLTWYARMTVPMLDLNSARNRAIPLMVERLEHNLGYRVYAFDTTTEHRIPSVWVMAVRPGEDETVPKVLCAGGASFDPERAIISALLELGPIVEWRRDTYRGEAARGAEMVDDPHRVIGMEDHALVNAHPAAFSRFAFLLEHNEPRPVADAFTAAFQPAHDDLAADLRETVARYLRSGQDVVVVDQTTPEHRAGRFTCVKVLIPGLLPMTFGYWARRTDGLPRLLRVPHELGYAKAPLRPQDINPHPHPFP
jgi:ribosomal protein S12 methylthiotransferase accessory factor